MVTAQMEYVIVFPVIQVQIAQNNFVETTALTTEFALTENANATLFIPVQTAQFFQAVRTIATITETVLEASANVKQDGQDETVVNKCATITAIIEVLAKIGNVSVKKDLKGMTAVLKNVTKTA